MKYKWAKKYNKKVTSEINPKEVMKILTSNREIEPTDIKAFLNPQKPAEYSPAGVGIDQGELKKAVEIIKKIGKDKKIIIYGDYDIDGLTASAVLWESLWNKSYDVLPFVPNREVGYGLKKEVIAEMIKDYPDLELIITVDNGIVAYEAVEFAKDQGLKVIVTDHHLPGDEDLTADAIVHTTEIAGCGVAWFLAREFGYKFADLVALGTIGDLLPVVGPNRSFVKFGLKELSKSNRPGIKALKKVSGLELNQLLSPWQISFILSPRLNAAGRISDPMDSLRLLCTRSKAQAFELAENLDGLNTERQEMMGFGVDLARELFTKENGLILVSSPDFHPGIIGLIAGKLTEEFGRPVVAVSVDKEVSKGSARSVPGVDIVDLIREAEDLLIDVGGHPMAAGFSVQTEKLEKLFNNLHQIAEKKIKKSDLVISKNLDFEIDFSMINKTFYNLTQKLSPFGVGNPNPTFLLKNARIVNLQTVGRDDSHLKLKLDDPETPKIERILAEVIGFGFGDWQERLMVGDMINLVFNFNLNRWNGRETLQLKIKDIEVC